MEQCPIWNLKGKGQKNKLLFPKCVSEFSWDEMCLSSGAKGAYLKNWSSSLTETHWRRKIKHSQKPRTNNCCGHGNSGTHWWREINRITRPCTNVLCTLSNQASLSIFKMWSTLINNMYHHNLCIFRLHRKAILSSVPILTKDSTPLSSGEQEALKMQRRCTFSVMTSPCPPHLQMRMPTLCQSII